MSGVLVTEREVPMQSKTEPNNLSHFENQELFDVSRV